MATTGIDVKMGVSGVSQFKQGIKDAENSIKTLDQALALNEKQFKATGDSEEYLSTKTELLKVKMAEQQSVVENAEAALKQMAESGVDKASASFQAMQQKLLKAKGELLDTETNLKNVDKAGEDADTSIKDMNTSLENIGKNVSFEVVTKGIDAITGAIETAAKAAIDLGKKITKYVLGEANWADDLATRATFYGVSQDELQRMDKTAALIDTDTDTIINARKKLKIAMSKEGSKETMGAFAALGLDPTNHDWETMFWNAGEALKNYGDEVNREAYAQKLFGKSWNELLPLFEAGREKYEETMKSWNTVSQENVDKLTSLDDSYQTFQNELETLKATFAAELAPAVQMVTDALTKLMQEFNKYIETEEGKEAMKALGDAVSSLFSDLTKVDFADAMEKAKGAINGLKDGLIWIKENSGTLIKALEGIGIAFAGLKVASGVLKFFQLVSGFKGLGLGGSAGAAFTQATATGSAFLTSSFGSLSTSIVSALTSSVIPITLAAITVPALLHYLQNPPNGFDYSNPFQTPEDFVQQQTGATAEEAHAVVEAAAEAKTEKGWTNNSLLKWALTGDDSGIKQDEKNKQEADAAWEEMEAGAKRLEEYLEGTRGYIETTGDPIYKDRRPGKNGLDELQSSMDKMNEAADGMTTASTDMTKSMVKPEDLAKLDSLPEAIAAAVQKVVANIKVYMDSNQVGASVAGSVNGAMGVILAQYRK